MEKEKVIIVENVKKTFKVYSDRGNTLKERIITRGRGKYEKRDVLKGISFNVQRGEAIGLIGKNGCGKSTTLKLLTKIIYPDSGNIQIKGKISSLLELGAGFHPDMSGRENVYLNASIFGLTKKEIDQKIEDIIAFSELEQFIENPVRTYSSGMYMRLAFSVAINVNADILLIDEILGVGDVSFQKKCFEKLKEIRISGTTIVIVSHSLEQIEQICDRSIWLSDGKIQEEGKPRIVNAHYYKAMEDERLNKKENEILNIEKRSEKESPSINQNNTPSAEKKHEKVQGCVEKKHEEAQEGVEKKHEETQRGVEKKHEKVKECRKKQKKEVLPSFCDKMAVRTGNRKVEIRNIKIANDYGTEMVVFEQGTDLRIICDIAAQIENATVSVSVSIWRDDGILCYGVNTFFENERLVVIKNSKKVEIRFPNISLLGGKYWLNVSLYSKELEEYDVIKYAKQFYIKSDVEEKEYGVYHMEHLWRLDE